ncbi:MFS transporter, partial [Streptomyces sp. NEAU-H3]|nr:MFS transporter [Streptomyces sp. NEAU-H3]
MHWTHECEPPYVRLMPAVSTEAPEAPRPDALRPVTRPASPAPDRRLRPGGPGFRRMSLALFLAGVATFALLYATQALLPLLSADFHASASDTSWTVSAAT